MFTYNRLLVLINCESGRRVMRYLLSKYDNAEYLNYSEFESARKPNIELLKYLSASSENKIVYSFCNNPIALNRLVSYSFKGWKFVYIFRTIRECFATHVKVNGQNFKEQLLHGYSMESNLNVFYQRIFNQCLRINFEDFIDETTNVINKVFNFIELPIPNQTLINESIEYDDRFKQFKSNILSPRNTFEQLLSPEEREIVREFARKPTEIIV